jgi:hypothetical protein
MLTKSQRLARLLRQPVPFIEGILSTLLQETGANEDIILTEDGDTIVQEDDH